MPKGLWSRSQEMVLSLTWYSQQERDKNGPFLPLLNAVDRVASALKLSDSTVDSVAVKCNEGEVLKNPSKRRKRTKSVVNIDYFDQIAIQKVIMHEIYNNNELRLEVLKDLYLVQN